MDGKQFRILVVDDEAAIAQMIQRLLENEGCSVAVAHDGAEGLKQFRASGHFDLVISDVLMPQMNGIEMVREIIRIAPQAKVIFVTGYTDETVNPRIGELPFEVIRKPFNGRHFLDRVRATLLH